MTAYGAIPVHMPFTQVTAALTAGTVDVAENGNDIYLLNKQYEIAPVLSLTQHEANTNIVFASSKMIASLERNQQRWVTQAFEYAQHAEVPRAIELDHVALDKLKAAGATINANVNKTSFSDIAHPIVDQQGQALGPFSQLVIKQIRALQ
jgi:TRAP-type C4-dicarboxylate transport system substrate-binding protein